MSDPPLIEAISEDPVLRNTKLISEAWDCDGLFQVGLAGTLLCVSAACASQCQASRAPFQHHLEYTPLLPEQMSRHPAFLILLSALLQDALLPHEQQK